MGAVRNEGFWGEVVPFPVVVNSKSHSVDVRGIPLLARDARSGAPHFVVVLTKPYVKGDGQECPSHTSRVSVRGDGRERPS